MPPSNPVDALRLVRAIRHIAVHPDGGWIIVFPPTNKAMNRRLLTSFPDARYVEGRVADTNARYFWLVPDEPGVATKIEAFAEGLAENEKFEFTEAARKRIEIELANALAEREFSTQVVPTKHIEVPGLRGTLREYQLAALEYGETRDFVYFADEMGLGKTTEAIAWAHARDRYPVIVTCPANARTNWRLEYERLLGDDAKVFIINGSPGKIGDTFAEWVRGPGRRVVVISYNALASWLPRLRWLPWKTLIADEAHYLRKMTARRTRNMLELSETIPRRALLSGTPSERGSEDLDTQLQILGVRDLFNGYPSLTGKGTKLDDVAFNRRLAEVCMLRRKKDQVKEQLPQKDIQWLALDIEEAKLSEYKRAEDDFRQLAFSRPDGSGFDVPMGALRRLVGRAKIDAVVEWMEPLWSSGAVPIVFCYHHDVIDGIGTALRSRGLDTIRYDGRMSKGAKDDSVKLFQEGKGDVFLAQIGAAGVALNLQRANAVIFTELDWLPTTHYQAIDRAHRLNSKHDRIDIRYLWSPNTLDEDIRKILMKRAVNIGVVTDGEEIGPKAALKNFLARRSEE